MRLANTAANGMLDNLVDQLDGGTLKIYSGTQPATVETAPSGTLLATFTLETPAFSASAAGVSSLIVPANILATVDGTATWARWSTSGAADLFDCTVGLSGADLVLNDTNIQNGNTVEIQSLTLTLPLT